MNFIFYKSDNNSLQGWFCGMERHDIQFTPKLVADIIRELPWDEPTKRKSK